LEAAAATAAAGSAAAGRVGTSLVTTSLCSQNTTTSMTTVCINGLVYVYVTNLTPGSDNYSHYFAVKKPPIDDSRYGYFSFAL
jgi:hypothetical protein